MMATFFVILFILTTVAILLLLNFQLMAFNPKTYKRIFIKEGIYQQLPTILAKQLVHATTYDPCLENPSTCDGEEAGRDPLDEEGGPLPNMNNLKLEDWKRIFSTILTPDWLQTQTESVIDQVFAYLNNKAPTLTIKISMLDLKARLLGEEGNAIILDLFLAQPVCTEEQLQLLVSAASAPDSSAQELLFCRPPEDLLEQLTPQMTASLTKIAEEIPDEINPVKSIFDQNSPASSSNQQIEPTKILRWIRLGIYLSPLLPLVSLLMVTILAIRSLKDLLRWWGIPIFLSGLITLGIGLASRLIIDWALLDPLRGQIPGVLEMSFAELGFNLVHSLTDSYVHSITIQCAILTSLGLLLTVTSLQGRSGKNG